MSAFDFSAFDAYLVNRYGWRRFILWSVVERRPDPFASRRVATVRRRRP